MIQMFLAPFFDLVFHWYDLRFSVSKPKTDVLEPVRELVWTHQGILTVVGVPVQVLSQAV